MTAATAPAGTRVPDIRLQATYRQYREHVMGDCFLCGRNLWCPVEVALGDAHDAAAREFAADHAVMRARRAVA